MFHLPGDTQSNKTISATLPRNIMRNEVLMMAFLYVLQQSPLAPIRAANVLCFARPDISNVARITSERSNVVDGKKKSKSALKLSADKKNTHTDRLFRSFNHSIPSFNRMCDLIWFLFFFAASSFLSLCAWPHETSFVGIIRCILCLFLYLFLFFGSIGLNANSIEMMS